MKINLIKSAPANGNTLVTFAVLSKRGKTESIQLSNKALQARLSAAIEDKTISGKSQSTTLFRDINFEGFRHVIIAGLGEKDHESVRRSAADVKKALSSLKTQEAFIDFDAVSTSKNEASELLQAFVEGALLASYEFNEFKSKKDDAAEKPELMLQIFSRFSTDAAFKKCFQEACILAEATNFSRRLGDMPGNAMTPTILANSAAAAAKGLANVKVTIWDKARIKKERMGGLLGVSEGSDQEPRFIILEYKGAAASKAPFCLVGKGLTFDSGGISIKPGAGMEEMKYDMCGGANVLGAFLAIARLKLKVNVVCLVASSENMPGPSATKPGDIHTARNGKTFEINNTDAEGRLILSDALSYASELKPAVICDAATLTGAMVVALGNIHTGFFTRDIKLSGRIQKAALETGELVWPMPIVDEHLKDMKGSYADLSNISSGKGAGSATAAAYLEQFVEAGIPWAHFDIAGTGWGVGNRLPWCSGKNASGVMVRTFVELAKTYVG